VSNPTTPIPTPEGIRHELTRAEVLVDTAADLLDNATDQGDAELVAASEILRVARDHLLEASRLVEQLDKSPGARGRKSAS
jgi:hypothetical protein